MRREGDLDKVPAIRPFTISDLAELAREGIKPPERICDDMLYRGSLHALIGDSGAGKTTLLYHWTVTELAGGYNVVLLDEEDGEEATVERLVSLGATPDQLDPSRLAYLDAPSRLWDDEDKAGFDALLRGYKPRLIGYVSASAILTMAGKNDNWTIDTIPIYKTFLGFSRRHKAAGVIVDHVRLSDPTRTRGSTAKRQLVDVQYTLEVVTPFTREQSGEVKLTIPKKDRRGYLHRAYDVAVDVGDGKMRLGFTKVEFKEKARKGKGLTAADRVLKALESSPLAPMTVTQIGDWLADHDKALKRNTISEALNTLSSGGLAELAGKGPKGAHYWKAT